jgi:hypothetical protein
MGYNKFRWWTKGKKIKPLPAHYPLSQKILNGEYDYSYMFAEAKEMRATAQKVYQQTYDNYGGTDQKNRIEVSLEASQMKRLKAIKLELEANKDEQNILYKLRRDLRSTFNIDVWDEAMEKIDGDLMALYSYYKNYARSKDSVL